MIFLFFSYRDLKVSGTFYFSLQPMCVEEGRVRVDFNSKRAIDCKPNKTLQHDFNLLFFIITIKLSFRIKQGFCVLVDNS